MEDVILIIIGLAACWGYLTISIKLDYIQEKQRTIQYEINRIERILRTINHETNEKTGKS